VEAGYQWPIGASSFVEPVASLSYSRTSFDDLPIPGGVQLIDDTDSFKGSLGLRLGTTASYQYYKLKVALEGRVWDEFDGDTNTTLVVASGPNFTNLDELDGVYGEVKGEANLFAMGNALSAFLNGGVKWKDHYQSTTVTLGVRYQW
jgi:outer membrane autotransporter protein